MNSILQGWKDVEKATDSAINSEGSSLEENQKYLDSILGKTAKLSSSFQQLSSNTVNSEWIKSFVDLINVLVKLIDTVGIGNIALLTFVGIIGSKSSIAASLFNKKTVEIVASLFKLKGASFAVAGALNVMIPIAILIAGIAIFNKLNVTLEEQQEKLAKVSGEYDEITSKNYLLPKFRT